MKYILLVVIWMVSIEAAAPVIAEVFASHFGQGNRIRITWKTDVKASSVVEYGPTESLGLKETAPEAAPNSEYHEVFIPKPEPGEVVHFRACSEASGEKACSGPFMYRGSK